MFYGENKKILQIECEKLCKIYSLGRKFLSSYIVSISSPTSPFDIIHVFYFVGPGHSSPFIYFRRLILQGFLLTHICKTHTAYEGIFLDFLYNRKKAV